MTLTKSVTAAILLQLCFLPATFAWADVWTKAKVDLVGIPTDRNLVTFVYLTDTSANPLFVKRYFRFVDQNERESLAILMAASTSDRKVHILSDIDAVGPNDFARIKIIYLTAEPIT